MYVDSSNAGDRAFAQGMAYGYKLGQDALGEMFESDEWKSSWENGC